MRTKGADTQNSRKQERSSGERNYFATKSAMLNLEKNLKTAAGASLPYGSVSSDPQRKSEWWNQNLNHGLKGVERKEI